MRQVTKKMYFFVHLFLFFFIYKEAVFGQIETKYLNESVVNQTTKQLSEWLTEKNIQKYIKYENNSTEENNLEITLTIPNLKSYQLFDSLFYERNKITFLKFINDKLLFNLDLNPGAIKVKLNGSDCVIFGAYDKEFNFSESIFKKMGDGVQGVVNIPLVDVNVTTNKVISTKKNDELKLKISDSIKNYIKNKNEQNKNYIFEILNQVGKNLIIDIKNAKNIIIDNNSYERIRIIYTIDQDKDNLIYKYTIFGKYAGGILWAPSDSRYRDMEPKFNKQLEDFSLIVGDKLYKSINQ